MFKLVEPMVKYLNGTLPVPRVTDGNITFDLLPCNPAHQGMYPEFFGYLKTHPKDGVSSQAGINVRNKHLTIGGSRNIAGRDLNAQEIEILKILISAAEREGHKFPEYKID